MNRSEPESLEQEVARLLRADEVRIDLIQRFGHDLRTPLSTIIGFSDLILTTEQRLDPRTTEYLGTIQRNGQVLLEMLNEYLDLNLLQARRISLHRDDLHLNDIRMELGPKADGIEWPTDTASVRLHGDRRRIVQAISLLIDNARRHAPRQTAIRVESDTGPAGTSIAVVDHGPMVSPQDVERVFLPYAPRTLNGAKIDNPGVGLSLVKAIAEAHGGWASAGPSEVDRGCAFRITLPPAARP